MGGTFEILNPDRVIFILAKINITTGVAARSSGNSRHNNTNNIIIQLRLHYITMPLRDDLKSIRGERDGRFRVLPDNDTGRLPGPRNGFDLGGRLLLLKIKTTTATAKKRHGINDAVVIAVSGRGPRPPNVRVCRCTPNGLARSWPSRGAVTRARVYTWAAIAAAAAGRPQPRTRNVHRYHRGTGRQSFTSATRVIIARGAPSLYLRRLRVEW